MVSMCAKVCRTADKSLYNLALYGQLVTWDRLYSGHLARWSPEKFGDLIHKIPNSTLSQQTDTANTNTMLYHTIISFNCFLSWIKLKVCTNIAHFILKYFHQRTNRMKIFTNEGKHNCVFITDEFDWQFTNCFTDSSQGSKPVATLRKCKHTSHRQTMKQFFFF